MNEKPCPICGEKLNFKHLHVLKENSLIYYKCPHCCFVCWFEENSTFGLPEGVYRYEDFPEKLKEKFPYEIIDEELLGSKFKEIETCPYCNGEVILWKKRLFEYKYKEEIRERTDYIFVCKDCGTLMYFGKFEKESEKIENDVSKEVNVKNPPICPFCNNVISQKHQKLNEILTSFKCNCGHVINRMMR